MTTNNLLAYLDLNTLELDFTRERIEQATLWKQIELQTRYMMTPIASGMLSKSQIAWAFDDLPFIICSRSLDYNKDLKWWFAYSWQNNQSTHIDWTSVEKSALNIENLKHDLIKYLNRHNEFYTLCTNSEAIIDTLGERTMNIIDNITKRK